MWDMIRYSFLTKIRNRDLIFWPLVFPFVLTTAMYFSIGQVGEADFETVEAAIVTEAGQNEGDIRNSGEEIFSQFLEGVEEDSDLIRTMKMTEADAVKALENGEVDGIFYSGEDPSLTVSGSGFPSEYTADDSGELYGGKADAGGCGAAPSGRNGGSSGSHVGLWRRSGTGFPGGRTTDGTAQFFYALLGMACLYGCFIGYNSAMELQANLTPLAARRCAGPVNRLSLVLTETLVSFGLHFVNMVLLLAYMKYILKLGVRGILCRDAPALFLGSMIGVTMGMFITSVGKAGEGVKIGIMVGVSMALSFLAGTDERGHKKRGGQKCAADQPDQPGCSDLGRHVLYQCVRRPGTLRAGYADSCGDVRDSHCRNISDHKEGTLCQYLELI